MNLKNMLKFLLLLVFGTQCLAQSFPERTWVSSSGVRIQARMLGFDGTKVTIERNDSKKFAFPLSLLSQKDQQYVRETWSQKNASPTAGIPSGSPVAISTGVGNLPIWSPQVIAQWWDGHAGREEWKKGSEKLLEDLRATWADKKLRSAREGRDFFHWFDHWRWVKLFLEIGQGASSSELEGAFVSVGKDHDLQKTFLKALHPEDNQPRALALFLSLASTHPDKIEKYASLASAYAVVFDQPFPRNWPHHQVPKKDVPASLSSPVERFADMVKAHSTRKLEYDPSQLSVTELKFVIDHPLSTSELEWARERESFRRTGFGKIFSSIQYDHPRLKASVFSWPHGKYSLESIRSRGGICVDQAYFSSMVGKAKGIPTLTFVGQGSGGGHAWFGFLKSPGRWETDCGRYENQNYPVGNAIDPQLWKPITDDELGALARGEKNLSGFRGKAVDYFAWALVNRDAPFYRESLVRARTLHPTYVDVWKKEAEWVQSDEKDLREKKNFWVKWLKAFSNTVDLKIEGQKKLAEVYDKMGNPREAEKIRTLIVRQNRSGRFDLAIAEGAEQLMAKVEAKKWTEAEKSYERMVKDFEKTAGGELFYGLIRPYVRALIDANQRERATDAIEFLKKRKVLDLGPGSILGLEMNKLLGRLN
jgi:hypothetical protein